MTKLIIDWCGDILLIGWTSLMLAVAVLAARSIAATVRRRARYGHAERHRNPGNVKQRRPPRVGTG
jgi:hypothetical protein